MCASLLLKIIINNYCIKNFGLPGADTSYYAVTIESVNGSQVSATHVVDPVYSARLASSGCAVAARTKSLS